MPLQPQFDPLGYIRRLEQIQADLMLLRADLDDRLARVLRNQAAILTAVNKPAWLYPPTAPSSPADAPRDTTVNVILPVIDVSGQIPAMLASIKADTTTLISDEVKDMSALTDLQGAVSALSNAQAADAAAIQAAVAALGAAAASGSVSATDVESAVTTINNAVAAMMASDTALNSAVNPTPSSGP